MIKPSTRRTAAELIREVLERRKTLDAALNNNVGFRELSGSNRGFARSIASSALRQLGRIDLGITPFLDRPLEATSPEVRALLRIGAAQLWILRNPAHAVVNETVEAARHWPIAKRASGLINAVLRKLSLNREIFDAIAVQKIWPSWLTTLLSADLSEEQLARLAEMQKEEPLLHLSVKDDPSAIANELCGTVSPVGGVYIENKSLFELPSFKSGEWWVQDIAATLAVSILNPQEEELIIDLCAAPGGKTMQLANAKARVIAVDQSQTRMKTLSQNLTRTKLSAKMVVSKVEDFKPTDSPSKILIDAPCSAMGTLRRHPEGAWIKHSDDLVRFPEIQKRLLRSARNMSSVGTVVVYSVCTPFKREGKDVINEVLSEGGLQRLPIKDEDVAHLNCRVDADGDVLTIPSEIDQPCDAFFIARLKKL